MADSLQDIGSSTDIFRATPNWVFAPSTEIVLPRYLSQYRGTAQALAVLTDDAPVSWGATYVTISRVDEEEMLDFIHDHLGNAHRFWCIHPSTFFELKTGFASGSGIVRVQPNSFDLMFQGYERIAMELTDGSLITRQVVDAVYDETNDRIDLTLNTVMSHDVEPEDVVLFGRLFLVRFNQTEFDQEVLAEYVSQWTLRFAELVDEYEDSDL